jgi:hypothetical protein
MRVGAWVHTTAEALQCGARGSACCKPATSAKGVEWDHESDNRLASNVERPLACSVNQTCKTGEDSPVGWLTTWVRWRTSILLASAGRSAGDNAISRSAPHPFGRASISERAKYQTQPGLGRSRPSWRLRRVVKAQWRAGIDVLVGRGRRGSAAAGAGQLTTLLNADVK